MKMKQRREGDTCRAARASAKVTLEVKEELEAAASRSLRLPSTLSVFDETLVGKKKAFLFFLTHPGHKIRKYGSNRFEKVTVLVGV